MKCQLTVEQARQRRAVGLTTEGFRIVARSLESKLIDALRLQSAFVTHADFQLLVNMRSEKSAEVFSTKDNNRYQVEFELDVNEDPRITKITPLGRLEPNQEVIREQARQKRSIGLSVTKEEEALIQQLNERDEKRASQKRAFEQLKQRKSLGLISEQEYLQKRDQLLIEQSKSYNGGKRPLFEDGDDNVTRRAKIWDAQRRGELTIDQAAEQAAKIRLEEEAASRRPQLLNEKRCAADCDCEPCTVANQQAQLQQAYEAGRLTRDKYELCLERLTCSDPARQREIDRMVCCYS